MQFSNSIFPKSLRISESDFIFPFLLGCIALVVLLVGINIGYFLILRIEWGAILGGLALAGTIILFPNTGKWLQILRVILLIFGIALAGAGLTDLFNLPKSNSDVLSGWLTGGVIGFTLAWYKLREGLRLIKCQFIFSINRGGALVAFILFIFGLSLFFLVGIIQIYGIEGDSDKLNVLAGIVAALIQFLHLRMNGSIMNRDAKAITLTALLIFLLCLWIIASIVLVNSNFLLHGLSFVLIVGVMLWGRSCSYRNTETPVPSNTSKLTEQLLIFCCMGGLLFAISIFYGKALYYLETNASPTQQIASGSVFFELGDEAFIKLMMRDIYYWDSKSAVSMSKEDTPKTYVKKLANDRWSGARTIDENKDWEEGYKYDRGITLTKFLDKFIITYVNSNSPSSRAGFERGDIFIDKSANTQEIVVKPSGEKIPFPLRPEKYKADVVIHKVIQNNTSNVGYLWLLNFSNATIPLIQEAFKEFGQKGVQELVLDLRYNHGGHISILLEDLIAGDKYDGKVFSNQTYSDKYVDLNNSIFFSKQPNSISIKRVFVITTHETCSSSELIINGLRPYIPVITIGEKTCGKPYLMNKTAYKGYVYTPVTGHMTNALGMADYENGIEPDCKVEENFNYPIGQKGDAMLDVVLYFQKNNVCPVN